jgi:hypothetical protein
MFFIPSYKAWQQKMLHDVFFPTGSITELNIYDLIKEDAFIYSVLLTGQQLKDTLEISVSSVNNSNATDFLHVSGKYCTLLCILCIKCVKLIHNGEVISVQFLFLVPKCGIILGVQSTG